MHGKGAHLGGPGERGSVTAVRSLLRGNVCRLLNLTGDAPPLEKAEPMATRPGVLRVHSIYQLDGKSGMFGHSSHKRETVGQQESLTGKRESEHIPPVS